MTQHNLLFAQDALNISNKHNKKLQAILYTIKCHAEIGHYDIIVSSKWIDKNIKSALVSLGYKLENVDYEEVEDIKISIKISWSNQ